VPDPKTAAAPSPDLLRLALGFVYLHFGLLKFFPDLSPAEMLASQTIMRLSWSWLDARTALQLLAVFECAIGLGFLFDVARRWMPWLFFAHMAGTVMPLFVLPELVFKFAPFAPTLEGQYILKNLVFVAAGWTVLVPRLEIPRPSLAFLQAWIPGRVHIPSRARIEAAARSRV
jgi:uncharacterized membrane protein YkgB